jgi:hypothetical protein
MASYLVQHMGNLTFAFLYLISATSAKVSTLGRAVAIARTPASLIVNDSMFHVKHYSMDPGHKVTFTCSFTL